MNKSKIKKVGQDVIKLESAALAKLSKSLDKNFVEAVELISNKMVKLLFQELEKVEILQVKLLHHSHQLEYQQFI